MLCTKCVTICTLIIVLTVIIDMCNFLQYMTDTVFQSHKFVASFIYFLSRALATEVKGQTTYAAKNVWKVKEDK